MTEVIKDLESDMASTAEVLKAQTAEVVATMTAEISEQQAKIVVLEKAVANNGPAPREGFSGLKTLASLEHLRSCVRLYLFSSSFSLVGLRFDFDFQNGKNILTQKTRLGSTIYAFLRNSTRGCWNWCRIGQIELKDRWDIGEDEEEERRRPDIAKRSPAAVRRASISPRAYAINTKQLIQVVASPPGLERQAPASGIRSGRSEL
ncbi:hypothetical protein K1719_043689 [Acacia pycnantha]|nr:hypothetical protein K1719_043689 [Acacia pycnantha]